MARSFASGSSQYAENGAAAVAAAPVTLACWASFSERTSVQTLLCVGVNSANGNYFAMDMAGAVASDPIRALTGAGVGANSIASVNGPTSDNTWGHCGAVFASATSRVAYFNGSAGSAETTSRSPSGLNRTAIGRLLYESGSILNYANGLIAEAAVWSAALSAADMLQLAAGVSPRLVRPDALVAYWPLIGRDSPEPDRRGGYDLTLTGTSQAAHPRVYYPGRRKTVFVPGAGGTFSDATGSASLVFSASAVGSSLASVAGSSSIAFTATAAGAALASATGTATLAFAALAIGSTLVSATGTAALAFTVSAVGSSLADASGTATLTFAASAESGTGTDATGTAALTFAASAAGSALVSATGVAAFAFTATAAGAALASATGTATLTFSASALSGSETATPGGTARRSAWSWRRVAVRPPRTNNRRATRASFNRVARYQPVANTMTDITVFTKPEGEDRDFLFDFSKLPEIVGGLTISSAETLGGDGLTLGTATITTEIVDGVPIGKGVTVRVSGGSSEEEAGYGLAVRITLSNGRRPVMPALVIVTTNY